MKSLPKHLLAFLILSRLVLFFLPFINPAWSWNRWDGPHYLYLAQNGYTNVGDESNFIVFLPAFPILVRAGLFFSSNPEIIASGISTILFVVACWIFYQISNTKTVFLLSIFPTAYFFSAPYTESLFLILISLVFFFAGKKKWLAAGLAAGVLTLTRPFGFLAISVVGIEWLLTKKKRVFDFFLIVTPTIAAILAYLYLNKVTYSDYFAFQKILHNNWYKSFSFPWKGIMESFKREDVMTGLVEGITSLIAWILVPISFIKGLRIRLSYSVYYFLGVVMFTSTSFILSAPRYMLSLLPFFIILSKLLKNRMLYIIWSTFSSIAFVYLIQLFFAGQWAF